MYEEESYRYYQPPKSPVLAAILTSIFTTITLFFALRILEDRRVIPGRHAPETATAPASPAEQTVPAAMPAPLPAQPAAVSVIVPGLAGLKPDEATLQLATKGLQAGAPKPMASEAIAAGFIAQTDPPAGATVAAQSIVTLMVSSGPAGKPVPKVTGLKLTKAKAMLEEAGFKLGKTRYTYDERYGGYLILRQEPAYGTQASLGSAIDLTINEGD